jgi:hypothetical protein
MMILVPLCLGLVIGFAIVETVMHRRRVTPWLALPYFIVLGIGLAACAFGLINYLFAAWASTEEARGWSELFSLLGFVTGGPMVVCCGIVAAIAGNRLSTPGVVGGTAILFCLLVGLFAICAVFPDLNWW